MIGNDRLTLQQAAALAGYTDPATLRQAIRRGTLAAEREDTPRGPVWYVTRDQLAAYLAQRPPWKQDQRAV